MTSILGENTKPYIFKTALLSEVLVNRLVPEETFKNRLLVSIGKVRLCSCVLGVSPLHVCASMGDHDSLLGDICWGWGTRVSFESWLWYGCQTLIRAHGGQGGDMCGRDSSPTRGCVHSRVRGG